MLGLSYDSFRDRTDDVVRLYDPEVAPSRHWWTAGTAVLFCLAGFVLAIGIAAKAIPRCPDFLGVGLTKLERDCDYTMVFLGPSQVANQVAPSTVDAHLAALGYPHRSVVLGANAATVLELSFWLRHVLRSCPQMKWVVIDPHFANFEIAKGQADTRRMVDWHDAATLGLMLDIDWTLAATWGHVRHFAKNLLSIGCGARWKCTAEVTPWRARHYDKVWSQQHGFFPMRDRTEDWAKRQIAATVKKARTIKNAAPLTKPTVAERRWLELTKAEVEAHGARLILLNPPSLDRRGTWFLAAHNELGVPVLDFSEPARAAPLYEEKYRNDGRHINEAGSHVYSRMIADALVKAEMARAR